VETLTVWVFRTPSGAAPALLRLGETALEVGASLEDAALLTWPESRRKPAVRHLGALRGPGTLWGGFWGVLFGLLFLVPLAGPTFGAAAGAFGGSLSGLGFTDDFVKHIREVIVPGTSALFVLSGDAAARRLAAGVGDLDAEVLRCELAPEHARRLHEALGEEIRRPGEEMRHPLP
jgi:uncharacterized membrane protein